MSQDSTKCCKCHCMEEKIKEICAKHCGGISEEKVKEICKEICEECCDATTNKSLKGMQAQATLLETAIIEDNAIIKFDTVLNNVSDIELIDGGFVVKTAGNYLVNYEIALSNISNCAIAVNGEIIASGISIPYVSTSYPYTGSGLLTLNANDVVTIVNTSGKSLNFSSNTTTQANITITKVD